MPPKREVISLQKGDPLTLTCEWQDCQEVFEVMTDFLLHVTDHLEGTATSEKHNDEWFVCHWRECGLDALSEFVELVRHVYFHAFHVKIKSIGMSLILKNQLRGCLLESVSRNMIPELPDQLQCGWIGCEALFDNAERFYIHVRSHADCYTEGNNVPGGCRCMWDGCSMVAKSKHKLKDHLKSHTQEKVVACPTCGSLFSNTTKFFDHIKRQTDTEVQNYQCSHCSKKFATERLLRDHMRHHVNHYKCPFCDMTCPTPSGLRTHIRYRHTTEKPFKCDECEFRGKTTAVLRRHMETHSKTWFKCDMHSCKYKSHNLSDMNGHYRKCHEGPCGAKYMCHLCDMRYERGHRLTLHLKKKHKFKWPSGHNRFRYKLHDDGLYRLQTVRYESIELAEQMLGSDNKIDDSDSTGNMSETVAPSMEQDGNTTCETPGDDQGSSRDDDYSYNLQMLGEVALHFTKGHQSLKGSETDLKGEGNEGEGSDDMGGSIVQSLGHPDGHYNDSVVDSTCDSMDDRTEYDFGGEHSQEAAEGGSDTSHQVEKYVLSSGVKLSIPPGTVDVIDNMLVCVSPTPTTSHDDMGEMMPVTVIATGDSSSSQMGNPGSVEGPSQNLVFTEVPTVLDLSRNFDFVIVRSDTWDSDDAEDLSQHRKLVGSDDKHSFNS